MLHMHTPTCTCGTRMKPVHPLTRIDVHVLRFHSGSEGVGFRVFAFPLLKLDLWACTCAYFHLCVWTDHSMFVIQFNTFSFLICCIHVQQLPQVYTLKLELTACCSLMCWAVSSMVKITSVWTCERREHTSLHCLCVCVCVCDLLFWSSSGSASKREKGNICVTDLLVAATKNYQRFGWKLWVCLKKRTLIAAELHSAKVAWS